MKKEYASIPASMAGMQTYGFSWMDFVTAIPQPLLLVTSYKKNGKPNACMQSWACFTGDARGFYAIFASVNKAGHMYQTIRQTGAAALNFPCADCYDQCLATIGNNGEDADELALCGLTSEPCTKINAPRVKECFLNLECEYLWEKAITPENNTHVVLCMRAVNVCMDEKRMNESALGRYGESGYLYNIHHPVDPEHFSGKAHDYTAILQKFRDMGEY